MPTVRGWIALGVAGALAVLWIVFGELEMLATALFLGLATGIGVVFVRYGAPSVAVSRQLHPIQAHEGDRVVVEVDVVASRRVSNLSLSDTVHGLGVATFAAARTSPGQPLVARYEVFCRNRGVYPVGPAVVGVTDPFTLAERSAKTGAVDRLVVYPSITQLSGFPAVRGHDPATQSTRPTFAPHGGEDFFTLREYQVGDDLRRVHWPSSAKRDELMIKQLEVPWQARALVLLDQRADRFADEESFEQAVRGAASVTAHLFKGGFSPELWAGERAPGTRSGDRYSQAMELLASVQPLEHLDLRRTVARLRRSGVGGGALVIVTGTPDHGVMAAYRALAQDFTRTVLMAVTELAPDIATFQRAGAITVTVGTQISWAPAWRTAMELSWSSASAG